MYHLDNSSGVATRPDIPAVKNAQVCWFTEGGNGVPPSYPGAHWFNIIQAELLNVLNEAGESPQKAQLNQLTIAIKKIIDNKIADKAALNHTHAIAGVTGLPEALQGLSEKGKALKDEIDGLEVGGRNYLRNSHTEKTANSEYLLYAREVSLKKLYLENDEITISFDIKVAVAGRVQVYSSNSSGVYFSADVTVPEANKFYRRSVTVKPVPNQNNPTINYGTLEFYGTYNTGRVVTVKNVKIEKGNRPTDWSPAPEDLVQEAQEHTRQNYVAKSGDTMSGPLNINYATSYLRGKNNGVDDWFVGRVRNNDNDVALASYQHSTGVHLKADRVESNKPIYRGTNQVFDEGNLLPVKHINLRATIPGTQIEYQNATPSELPIGSYAGYTTNAQLSNSGVYSGWGFVSKIDNTQAFRQTVNFDRFFAQWGTLTNGWGGVNEYFMVRPPLGTGDLNNVTVYGVYAQMSTANALLEQNYPAQEPGTLLVTPSVYGCQQEYTTFYGNRKFVRGRAGTQNGEVWQPWERIDALDSVSKAGDTMTGDLRLRQKIILDSMLMQFGGDDFIHKDNSGTALHGYHFVEDSLGNPRKRGNATLWANDFVAGNDKRLSSAMMAGDVAVLTGEIAHGGTIPLPAGFVQEQCKWAVMPRVMYDLGGGDINSIQVYADGNRLVSVLTEHGVLNSNRATYIIVGIK